MNYSYKQIEAAVDGLHRGGGQLSLDKILAIVKMFPKKGRARIDRICLSHVAACRRSGVPPSRPEHLIAEAIQIAFQDLVKPALCQEGRQENTGPVRSYTQYVAPRDPAKKASTPKGPTRFKIEKRSARCPKPERPVL